MPTLQEACCGSKDECLGDVKAEFPPVGLIKSSPALFTDTFKCGSMTNEVAKENLIKSAVCNFWCQIAFSVVAALLGIIIYELSVGFAIQNLAVTIIAAFLSLWFLRCCLQVNSKCWWTVLVVFMALGMINIIYAGIMSISQPVYGIVVLISSITPYCLFIYALRYLKTHEAWEGSSSAGTGASAPV